MTGRILASEEFFSNPTKETFDKLERVMNIAVNEGFMERRVADYVLDLAKQHLEEVEE